MKKQHDPTIAQVIFKDKDIITHTINKIFNNNNLSIAWINYSTTFSSNKTSFRWKSIIFFITILIKIY